MEGVRKPCRKYVKYVLVNESSGGTCCLNTYNGMGIGSRSTCYRVKKRLSAKFPDQHYAVYKLVRLGK